MCSNLHDSEASPAAVGGTTFMQVLYSSSLINGTCNGTCNENSNDDGSGDDGERQRVPVLVGK